MEKSLNTADLYQRLLQVYEVYWENNVYAKSKWPDSPDGRVDLRCAIFGLPGNALGTFQLQMQNLEANLKDPNYWQAYAGISDPEAIRTNLRIYDSNTRHMNFVLFFSRVEWVLRNMIMIVKPGACDNGLGNFKNIYDSLLAEIGLLSEVTIFDVARCIRNTIHNNGFYCHQEGKSATYPYRGQLLTFTHGKNTHLATSISFFLIEDMIRSCRKVVDSPKIAAFKRMDFFFA